MERLRLMKRRGFSFLELLVALAIVLIAAALSIPALMNFANERAFESGADLLVDQLLLARAAAQERGEPVEVVYLQDQRLVLARLFRPGETSSVVNPTPSSDRITLRDEVPANLTQPWARRAMTGTMVLSRQRPRGEPEEPVEPGSADPFDAAPLRLVVYLPDGTALMGDDVWLTDDRGRVGRLRVNPWTGLPRYEREVDRFDDEAEASGEESGDTAQRIEASNGSDMQRPSSLDSPAANDSPPRREDNR